MKTQFHIHGLNIDARLRRWLEQSLERLKSRIPITTAAVVVEQRRDNGLPVRAYVSLAVPGPDIHAEGRDHTLKAAWLKVMSAMRKQIDQRKARQAARLKTNGHVRAQVGRRTKKTAT